MNTNNVNRQIVLTSRPKGMPSTSNFGLRETSIPHAKDGEIVVKALYISVDPYMRGRMEDRPSYLPPFQINCPPNGGVVGKVVESKNLQYKEGDLVHGFLDWSEYCVTDGKELQKIDASSAPASAYLGVLGIPGLSAYFGLLDVGQIKKGETVVVSGAAGGVGSCAVQIAKIKGCRVVGIVGSEAKARYLVDELKVDAAVNYKDPKFAEKLKAACPKGVDVYFDNVGESVSNTVCTYLNKFARVVMCGQISIYNLEKPAVGLQNLFTIMVQSVTVRGFLVLDYMNRFPEAFQQLGQWMQEGKLQYKETVSHGIDSLPGAFVGLFTGQNTGKQVVKL
jgi:NADPH-dependent curcumin reductase CurA